MLISICIDLFLDLFEFVKIFLSSSVTNGNNHDIIQCMIYFLI